MRAAGTVSGCLQAIGWPWRGNRGGPCPGGSTFDCGANYVSGGHVVARGRGQMRTSVRLGDCGRSSAARLAAGGCHETPRPRLPVRLFSSCRSPQALNRVFRRKFPLSRQIFRGVLFGLRSRLEDGQVGLYEESAPVMAMFRRAPQLHRLFDHIHCSGHSRIQASNSFCIAVMIHLMSSD